MSPTQSAEAPTRTEPQPFAPDDPGPAPRLTDPAPRLTDPAPGPTDPDHLWWADRQPWRDILTSLALLCVGLVFLESVADILPDGTLFWLVTPSRAVLGIGLVAIALVAPRPSLWRTWLDVPLLVLVLAALLASYGRPDSMALWRWLVTEVSFFYLVVMVRRMHRDAHRAVLVFTLVGIAAPALAALQQSANQTPTGFCRAPGAGMADGCEQAGALVRVIGTFSNPNLLAGFLLVLLPLAWLAIDEWLNRATRLAGWLVIALAYAAILQTWSRAGIAAAVIGAVALFTLLRPSGRRLRAGGLVVLSGVVAAIGLVLVSGAGVRMQIWAEALRLAAANPLGVGMGRSGSLLYEAIGGEQPFQHAHNTWLNWLVEAGLLGFLAVLAITVLVCWRTWRSAVGGSRIAAACGAGLLSVGLMSLADHPANAVRIALAMAFVIGVLMSSPIDDQAIWIGVPGRQGRGERPARAERPEPPVTPAAVTWQQAELSEDAAEPVAVTRLEVMAECSEPVDDLPDVVVDLPEPTPRRAVPSWSADRPAAPFPSRSAEIWSRQGQ